MPGARDVRKSRQSVRIQYKAFLQCMPLDAPLRPNIFHGRKCQISRRFFGKNAGFHGILCCSLNSQHHLPALRPICVPNVTNGHFYRAMLCIRGTSHGPVSVSVSVCLSVTSRSSTKTAKRRITEINQHDSPGTLVFWCQRSPRNSTGVTPYEGAECRGGGSKSATFDKYPAISRKR